jgi:DNA ligase (NAD+)
VCTNDDCPGKLLGKWKYFVSKKAMDINGLSEQTLDRFLKCGFLTSEFESVYHLSDYRKELYKLDGFGNKSIDNILAAIEKSKDVDLQHFITAFSIPNIGEGQAKLICAVFKTFEDFADACEDFNFAEIPGIGSVLNGNIHRWWAINQQQMKKVASIVRFKGQKNEAVGTSLSGKTFVITGNVFHFKNRDELKEKIESLGGKVGSGVSKNTSYLINNDVTSTSGKNKKAQELNVPIISEDDFLKMIGEFL